MILLRSVLVLIARPSTAQGYVANFAQTSWRERLRAAGPTVRRGGRSGTETLVPAVQPLPAIRREFRWPRGRRRQTTPPHSRSWNRLKQETARPPRFPQGDPSFPAGSGIRTSASLPR